MTARVDAMKGAKMRSRWVEPGSVAEAQSRRNAVLSAIRRLQAELAAQSRVDPDTGKRLSRREYEDVRCDLQSVLDEKYTENRLLKMWIADHREEGTRAAYGIPTSGLLGLVTKRIVLLEDVLVAAELVLKDASDRNRDHLRNSIDKARAKAVVEEVA